MGYGCGARINVNVGLSTSPLSSSARSASYGASRNNFLMARTYSRRAYEGSRGRMDSRITMIACLERSFEGISLYLSSYDRQ